ncbi:hypothetical protein KVR01_011800 [Diaporthe batatas]|uniref:uncharacterized protein n=1 Tax=Diaporthe batatas TaxID=748121 RepID=UPI001D0424C4|nr:uncharacterized protein KVR01_011800 [Diaporthe batatas]KAG8158678.1 hypothetical protein KVR01_011800 [Diaporthe batatas]
MTMRLRLALTGLGLLVGHVAGHHDRQQQQQQWQDFGAMPAVMKQSFYDAVAARPASLAKRDGDCGDGRHPCSDLNSTLCCPNTDYCIINSTLQVQCCALGSNCGVTCGTASYFAEVTITEAITASSSTTTTTGTAAACVGRPCAGANYLCPQSMGGNCCAYGQACASNKQCLDFGGGGATTSTAGGPLPGPTLATMIPSGCSRQGDSTCSVGGPGAATTSTGCCGAGYTCAVDSGSRAVCAPATSASSTAAPAPTGSDISVVSSPRGLSAGAKAGIAVGVVLAAALAIGGATWFCLRRRRRHGARSTATTSANEMGSGVGGGGGRPGRHRLAAAGRYESDDGGIRAYGPSSGPHMSEADGASSSAGYGGGGAGGGGAGPLPGLGRDYFGPAAAASGPYSTPPGHADYQQHPNYFFGAGGGANDGGDHNARRVRGGGGGAPHGPGDITSAVEMGGGVGGGGGEDSLVAREKGGSEDGGGGSLSARRQGAGSPAVRDSIAGRFELYGTDVPAGVGAGTDYARAPRPLGTPGSELSASELGTPSPMSHEEQAAQAQQQAQGGKKGPAG